MEQFLSKHSFKIKLLTFLSILGAVGAFVWQASGVVAQVDENAEDIIEMQEQVESIPIIQTDIQYIREDIGEIKNLLTK